MERLEIYNEREKKSFEIDLKPDAAVSLQLKSNLFSPIDKITLNHSFTIQAPDTLQNRRAFGMGNQVAAESDQVRQKFPCKFYRNGVHILTGTCHVQSIENGSFSLLLVWGLDVMEELKEGGDLEDLELGNMTFTEASPNDDLPVPDYNTYAECMGKDIFFAHSNGDFAERNEWKLSATRQFTPCFSAYKIFEKCLETSRIAYEMDETAVEFMKRLAIPLPTLGTGDFPITISGTGAIDASVQETSYADYAESVTGTIPAVAYFIKGFSVGNTNIDIEEEKVFKLSSQCDIKMSFRLSGANLTEYMERRFRMCIVEYDDEGNESSREYRKPEYVNQERPSRGRAVGRLEYLFEDVEVSTSGRADVYFIFVRSTDETVRMTFDKFMVNYPEPPIKDGMELAIATNLPKLSKINYVKALCQICGIFPIPPVDGSNVVRFVAPGILEKNKANAVNWSRFVNGEPKKIAFAFSDFAQNNLITYKDGEKHAASFPMESPTSDKEKTAFELPFMHLVGGRWPLWSVEFDKDKKVYNWKRESVDPAIYILTPAGEEDDTKAYLSFDELTPSQILERWRPLTDAVKRAKVVQTELMLPPLELKHVDYSVPVYIEQLGGYFGIVSLNNSGNKTTAELIKI